jgi:hypothetical protein
MIRGMPLSTTRATTKNNPFHVFKRHVTFNKHEIEDNNGMVGSSILEVVRQPREEVKPESFFRKIAEKLPASWAYDKLYVLHARLSLIDPYIWSLSKKAKGMRNLTIYPGHVFSGLFDFEHAKVANEATLCALPGTLLSWAPAGFEDEKTIMQTRIESTHAADFCINHGSKEYVLITPLSKTSLHEDKYKKRFEEAKKDSSKKFDINQLNCGQRVYNIATNQSHAPFWSTQTAVRHTLLGVKPSLAGIIKQSNPKIVSRMQETLSTIDLGLNAMELGGKFLDSSEGEKFLKTPSGLAFLKRREQLKTELDKEIKELTEPLTHNNRGG